MAEAIVNVFRTSNSALRATVYLYDRFGNKSFLDFMQFFEEFGGRVRSFDANRAEQQASSNVQSEETESISNGLQKSSGPVSKRQEFVRELGQLSQRRDELEARLVRLEGGLRERERKAIEQELNDIHTRRIAVLGFIDEPKGTGVNAFISYAHEDEKLRIELGKHLRALERRGMIRTWHDRMIKPGVEYKNLIDEHLETSGIILLLISSDFLDSEYCYEIEMRRALEKFEKRESLVIPIILRPVVWAQSPFARLQVLPKDGAPVTQWSNPDAAFVSITEGIYVAVRELLASKT